MAHEIYRGKGPSHRTTLDTVFQVKKRGAYQRTREHYRDDTSCLGERTGNG